MSLPTARSLYHDLDTDPMAAAFVCPSTLSTVGSLSPQAVSGRHRTARVIGCNRGVLLLGLIGRSTQSDTPGRQSHPRSPHPRSAAR